MKKFTKVLAMILACTLFLTACGGGSGNGGNSETDSASSDGKTKLVFWHAMGGDTGKALEKLVDQYNQSQDKVVVEAQYQGSYDDTLTKLRSSASGSKVGADLVQVFELGTTFMIDSGLTVPVQDYIDKDNYDMTNYEPNLLSYYTIDGKLNSMPFNSSTPLMYYNKDYFDKAGITEAPKSLEEIIQLNDQIVNNTDAKMAMSLTIYGWYVEQFFSKMGLPLYDQGNGRDGQATKAVFDENGGMKKVLDTWKSGLDSGAIPNVGRNGGQAEFVSGDSAITLASTANLRQILTEVGGRFEVGTAYFPGITAEDQGGVSIGGASLWMINTEDQAKMDATWDFIKFLISPASQAQWNADTGYFPITTDAHEEQVFKDNLEEFPQFQTAIDQLHDSTPESQGALTGVNQEARQTMENEVEQVLNGNKTSDEAVSSMAEQINASLENYNAANTK